jgi:hypothetical protein
MGYLRLSFDLNLRIISQPLVRAVQPGRLPTLKGRVVDDAVGRIEFALLVFPEGILRPTFAQLLHHLLIQRDYLLLVDRLLVDPVNDLDHLEERVELALQQPLTTVHQRRSQKLLLVGCKGRHTLVQVLLHDVTQLSESASDDRSQDAVQSVAVSE